MYSAFHDQTKSRNMKFQDFVRLSERSVHKFTISIFFYDSALKFIFGWSDVPKIIRVEKSNDFGG